MIISSPMSRHRWCPRWWWWSLRRPCTSFPPGRKTGGNYEDGRPDEHWFHYIADYDGSNWYHPINHNTHYDQSELCRRPPQHPDLLRTWPNWPDWRANRWSGFRWSKVAVFGLDTAPCWYAEKKSEKTPPTPTSTHPHKLLFTKKINCWHLLLLLRKDIQGSHQTNTKRRRACGKG